MCFELYELSQGFVWPCREIAVRTERTDIEPLASHRQQVALKAMLTKSTHKVYYLPREVAIVRRACRLKDGNQRGPARAPSLFLTNT